MPQSGEANAQRSSSLDRKDQTAVFRPLGRSAQSSAPCTRLTLRAIFVLTDAYDPRDQGPRHRPPVFVVGVTTLVACDRPLRFRRQAFGVGDIAMEGVDGAESLSEIRGRPERMKAEVPAALAMQDERRLTRA